MFRKNNIFFKSISHLFGSRQSKENIQKLDYLLQFYKLDVVFSLDLLTKDFQKYVEPYYQIIYWLSMFDPVLKLGYTVLFENNKRNNLFVSLS